MREINSNDDSNLPDAIGDGILHIVDNGSLRDNPPRTPNCYITNYAGHDYEGADKYGTRVTLTQGFIVFDRLEKIKKEIAKKLLEALSYDYLVLSGSSVISTFCILYMFQRFGRVNIIFHDKTKSSYRTETYSAEDIIPFWDVIGSEK